MEEKKVRSSNLELFRIVAMFGIVMSHYQFFLTDHMAANLTSFVSIMHYMYSMWGKIGINCFMLITGYFMCTQSISIKKFVKLLAQIFFYKIIISVFLLIMGYEQLTLKVVIDKLVPFRAINQDSFVSSFLWFYLLIPFLSILVQNLNERMHKRLMLLLLVVYVGYHMPGFQIVLDPIMWFSVLFIIASYLRRHVGIDNLPKVSILGGGMFNKYINSSCINISV